MSGLQLFQMVEQNSRAIVQRDEEIRNIVESIAELGTIFKDLGNLIADQGTILDRIDYNMEQTLVKVRYELCDHVTNHVRSTSLQNLLHSM